MKSRSALIGISLGLLLSIFCHSAADGQTSATTKTEVWPEADVHIQLPSDLRVLGFIGLEQAVRYPFQDWYVATALDYQFKPILKSHWENLDPDKEHYFLFGGGYEFLHTSYLGSVTHENRVTIDLTFNVRPLARLLVRDRNWVELRWIDSTYSTTYRNLVSAEYDFRVHNVPFSPYGSAEFFYGGPDRSWPQERYTGGAQWPYKRSFMLQKGALSDLCSAKLERGRSNTTFLFLPIRHDLVWTPLSPLFKKPTPTEITCLRSR